MVKIIYDQVKKHKTPIKFIISGTTAAGVDFIAIYFLHSILLLRVVIAATIAYAIAFFVSFCLQKFWTFRDNDKERMSGQVFLYLVVGLMNLSINAGLMHLFVERYDTWIMVKGLFSVNSLFYPLIILIDTYRVWYIFVQAFVAGLLGISSFLIYKFVIFRKQRKLRRISDKNFRIVMAIGTFPPDISGPATYAGAFAEAFVDHGYGVSILTYGEKRENARYKIHTVSRKKNLLMRYWKYFWKLFIISSRADIVYSFDIMSTGLPCAIVKLFNPRLKLVTRLGGDYQWEQASQKDYTTDTLREYYNKKDFNFWEKIVFAINNFVLSKSNIIIFNSQFLRDIYLNSRKNIHKDKTVIIKNIEPNINGVLDERKADGVIRLLFAGRMIKIRNLLNLIKAFSHIDRKKYSKMIFLDLIGSGEEKKFLEKYIKEKNLVQNIHLEDQIEHERLMHRIKSSDILILPTITEINSNFIAEGIIMRKVIVHTKESELGYLGIKDDHIFYIDPLDQNDIREKIEKAIEYFISLEKNNPEEDEDKNGDLLGNLFWNKDIIIKTHLDIFDKLIK